MAIAIRQSAVAAGASAVTFSSATLAGSLIVVLINCGVASLSISDGGAAYSSAMTPYQGVYGKIFGFEKANAASGITTINLTGGDGYQVITAFEITGAALSNPQDTAAATQAQWNAGGSLPRAWNSNTLAQANNVVLEAWGVDSNVVNAWTPSGATLQQANWDGADYWAFGVASTITSSTAAVTSSWSGGNTAFSTLGAILVYKEAAAGGSGITGAGQIASGEAFGSPGLAATVAPAAIASAEASGAPSIGAGVSATGITSGEAAGTPAIAAGIAPAGIATGESSGSPVVAAAISASGIATAEAFGLPVVAPAGIVAAGIASAEALGQAAVAAQIAPSGVASGEAFGQPTVQSSGVFAVGIPSAEAFGLPSLAAAINAAGITSAEAFGMPLVGDAPVPTGMAEIEVDVRKPRRYGRKAVTPLLQRVLDAKYQRVKPAKERAQRRAKAIEQDAAQLIADDPQNEAKFNALMQQWQRERPVLPADVDPRAAFEAQVGFRLRQLELVEQARVALERERDDDDAIAVLLLLS